MDIIVTTPKGQMAAAAQEAADCRAAFQRGENPGEYFRRFPFGGAPTIIAGNLVYYVEDGFVRGYAIVSRVEHGRQGIRCDTTHHQWPPGVYVFMDPRSWHWIRPIPMRGFQGWRYARPDTWPGAMAPEMVGGWLDPKPEDGQ